MATIPPPREPFSDDVEDAFLDLIQALGYVNRERLPYAKYVRIQAFLDNPRLNQKDICQRTR